MSKLTDQEIGEIAAYNARQETIRLLQKKGPKLEDVLLRLRQALNAKEAKFFAHQGEIIEERDVIAHGHRLRAVDLALQLHDAMPSQKYEHTGAGGKDLDWKIEIISPDKKT